MIQRFYNEVFNTQIYEPVINLGQMGHVLDVGACTGEFSLWIEGQAKKVWAIEADQEAYELLEEEAKGHKKIKPVHVAIAGENKNYKIWGGGIGSKTILGGQPEGEIVQGKTLATFMKDNNIKKVDCLKIDVENAEAQIFDAQDFAEVAKDIKYIIGEHLVNCTTRLLSQGFTCEPYEYGIIARR